MKVKFSIWRWYVLVGSCLSVPAVAIIFLQAGFDYFSPRLRDGAFVFVLALGLPGALMRALEMMGAIQFTFSESDKKTRFYKTRMAMEQRLKRNKEILRSLWQ